MGRSSIVTTAKLINQSVSLQCFMMIQDKRQKPRVRFSNGMKVQIVASDGAWQHSCEIIDISETGAKLWFSNLLEMAEIEEFLLLLSSNGAAGVRAYRRCKVRWRMSNEMGVEFLPKELPPISRHSSDSLK